MKKSSIIFLVVSIIVFLGAVVFLVYAYNNQEVVLPEEEKVEKEELSETQDIEDLAYVDFTMYEKDGTEVKLSSFTDKPIMMLFWNPQNEKSVEEFQKINEFYGLYNEKVSFVILATCPTDEMKEEYEEGIDFEIYYDLYKEGAINYKINDVPSIVYIDKDQNIFNAKTGFSTTDSIEANLDILTENF